MRRRGLGEKPPKKLVSARDLLAGALSRTGYNPASYALFELWDRLLGLEAKKARAVGVKGGRLYVAVDTSVLAHGLSLRKRELLKKMNAPFGADAPLSDIIFQPGSRPSTDDNE